MIDREIAVRRKAIDSALGRYVPPRRDVLSRAMRYGLFSGGKRLRSVLVLMAGEAVGGERRRLLPFACGIEMIHAYSLIHDDLPAMDDDALRRGKPTTHRMFGEGTAILAGDALLTEAFRVMTMTTRGNGAGTARVLAAVRGIAAAAGMRGMVGGQVADLTHEGVRVSLATVRDIHHRKTAALIEAASVAGGLIGGAAPAAQRALSRYGRALGLAFQIADDVRDAGASSTETGKVAGRDRVLGKATYAAVIGPAASRAALGREINRAISALRPLGEGADLLRELARQVGAWGHVGRGGQGTQRPRRTGRRIGRSRDTHR
jgi:geranylgeranyl diphosphate synthase type II